MNKSDMIISIIIVLCIAAGVIAYGLTNSDNTIFSDLSSMGSGDNNGDGIGNNTTNGTGVGTGTGSSSGSGSSSSGTRTGSGSGSSSNSGNPIYNPPDPNPSIPTEDEIIRIANTYVTQDGWHASSAYYSSGYWYVTIVDADGNRVDEIVLTSSGANAGR